MDPLRELYLQRLGLVRWQRREMPVSGEEPDVVPEPSAQDLPAAPSRTQARPDAASWEELEAQVVGCVACELHGQRRQAVFGVGDRNADWMVIGEAPGAEEDRQGEPFVGRAGKLLDAMLRAAGLEREQTYIANILKCRPPSNRDPHPMEAAACSGFLRQQIERVAPKLILCVGRVAAQNLLGTEESMAQLRGRVHRHPDSGTPVIVTYHPAYLLRTPHDKRKAWEDLKLAMRVATETAR